MKEASSTKQKIEAIYPLTSMQQSLLFHHLTNEKDQGFLHVQCVLSGNLDTTQLQNAWQALIERHPILRTSIHWKNIKNPIQIVRPEKKMNWHFVDWTNFDANEIPNELEVLKQQQRTRGINLEKAPLAEITLIQIQKNKWYLLWNCHHILLDGWSSSTLFQDAFSLYNALCSGSNLVLETVPSYKSYLNWLQEIGTQNAMEFWKETFNGYTTPYLINNQQQKSNEAYKIRDLNLSEISSNSLKQLAKKYKITTNTLFQGIWSLLLLRYFDNNDIAFGTTVSGRSGDFPNMELMTGMFMNVLPTRSQLNPNDTLSFFFQKLQRQQLEARKYEHFSVDQITNSINWSTNKPLFDSLFIFENFPWKDITINKLQVSDFQSGLTTTYPITLTIKTGVCFNIHLTVNSDIVGDEATTWFLESFQKVISLLLSGGDILVNDLVQQLNISNNPTHLVIEDTKLETALLDYVAPTNAMELELTKIWESVFNKAPIGVNDNFFDLGGKSMLAIKLFTIINNKLETKLPPTTLLEYPTIATIANLLNKGRDIQSWEFIVPIRAKGKKMPLFCVHAGMGHVFFYKHLAALIDSERPVYAIQPAGIYDDKKMHSSIEEMAADYLREIRLIQPKGPYNIMVYCWSTAVGLEISKRLKVLDEEINFMVIDTIASAYDQFDMAHTKSRISEFTVRLFQNPFRAINSLIKNRISKRVSPIFKGLIENEKGKNDQKLQNNLIEIYKAYEWEKINGSITLLITNYWGKRAYQETVDSWHKLTSSNLKIVPLLGEHNDLFNLPNVEDTAEVLNKCLIEFETNLEKCAQ